MSQQHLRQISATYVPEEDRILLRLNTTTDTEYRFWVTRRYLALVWRVGLRILDRFGGPGAAGLGAELAHLTHVEMTRRADTTTPYKEGRHFPLGESPLLLARITHLPRALPNQGLRLEPAQGHGIDINVDEQLTHNLLRLLRDAAARAEWGLDLSVAATSDTPTSGHPRRLH